MKGQTLCHTRMPAANDGHEGAGKRIGSLTRRNTDLGKTLGGLFFKRWVQGFGVFFFFLPSSLLAPLFITSVSVYTRPDLFVHATLHPRHPGALPLPRNRRPSTAPRLPRTLSRDAKATIAFRSSWATSSKSPQEFQGSLLMEEFPPAQQQRS